MIDILTALSQLVACPSLTPSDRGCQSILINYLTQWGFVITELPCGDASNFWATHRDNLNPKLVLAGHTDVVPVGKSEEWHFPPFTATLHNGLLYGRGVTDMKGSLIAMLAAIENFLQEAPQQSKNIGFLITSAEEGPSELGTPVVLDYLKTQGIQFDYCLVGEPTCEKLLGDTIKNGRRGSLTGKLKVKGKQGHIAYPQLAINPIHVLIPFLTDFFSTQWDKGNLYFQATQAQISNIHAGTGAGNVIPGEIELLFNFRYSPEVTAIELTEKTEQLLLKHKLSYEIEWIHYGEPFLTSPGPLITALSRAIQQTCGITPQLSTTGGTSDARYIAKTGAQIVEFGLCNGTIHQVNEHSSLEDIYQLKEIYLNFFRQLLLQENTYGK